MPEYSREGRTPQTPQVDHASGLLKREKSGAGSRATRQCVTRFSMSTGYPGNEIDYWPGLNEARVELQRAVAHVVADKPGEQLLLNASTRAGFAKVVDGFAGLLTEDSEGGAAKGSVIANGLRLVAAARPPGYVGWHLSLPLAWDGSVIWPEAKEADRWRYFLATLTCLDYIYLTSDRPLLVPVPKEDQGMYGQHWMPDPTYNRASRYSLHSGRFFIFLRILLGFPDSDRKEIAAAAQGIRDYGDPMAAGDKDRSFARARIQAAFKASVAILANPPSGKTNYLKRLFQELLVCCGLATDKPIDDDPSGRSRKDDGRPDSGPGSQPSAPGGDTFLRGVLDSHALALKLFSSEAPEAEVDAFLGAGLADRDYVAGLCHILEVYCHDNPDSGQLAEGQTHLSKMLGTQVTSIVRGRTAPKQESLFVLKLAAGDSETEQRQGIIALPWPKSRHLPGVRLVFFGKREGDMLDVGVRAEFSTACEVVLRSAVLSDPVVLSRQCESADLCRLPKSHDVAGDLPSDLSATVCW